MWEQSLLAKALYQSTRMLNDTTLSRANLAPTGLVSTPERVRGLQRDHSRRYSRSREIPLRILRISANTASAISVGVLLPRLSPIGA